MKLHVLPGSPNCRKVLATLAHLNLEAELISHDLKSGGLKSEDYLGINPNGKVPTLIDNDKTLWESNAILVYLATSKDPESRLFPEKQRADILSWLFWEVAHFNSASGKVAWEVFAKPAFGLGDPIQSLIDEGTESFHRFAPVLENHLSHNKPYILGENVTIADFAMGRHASFFQVGNDVLDALLAPYPQITAWYQGLNEVPAWRETAPPWVK